MLAGRLKGVEEALVAGGDVRLGVNAELELHQEFFCTLCLKWGYEASRVITPAA